VLNLISLSTVVVGFSVYLFFPTSKNYDLIKLLLASTVLVFPTLFKLFLQSPIESISRQITVAQVYGLSPITIIIEVIIRQLKKQFLIWLSVLSVWFASDYAISKAVGLQTKSLGLMAQDFLSSYRMAVAYLMSLIIIVTILLFLILFNLMIKAIYVAYKKFAL
jgi:hypothetical protein